MRMPAAPASSSAPRALEQSALPTAVPLDVEEPVGAYWRRRLDQHTGDWYAGLRLQKLPEDLRVYEHLLWASAPAAVVELGSHRGGSTLWFRDRLAALDRYQPLPTGPRQLVAVSEDTGPAREGVSLRDPSWSASISFVDGDVRDPELPQRVAAVLPTGASCLVVEDTAHQYDTTLAALEGFAGLVAPGGFFVVEDGVVDLPGLTDDTDVGGVLAAVDDWLASAPGASFQRRRDLELYGLTSSPQGWLQRTGQGQRDDGASRLTFRPAGRWAATGFGSGLSRV